MSGPRKWLKRGVSIGGSVVGGLIAFSPTYAGFTRMASGDFSGGVKQLQVDLVGGDISAGEPPKLDRIAYTGLTVATGIGVAWLFKQLARRL